MTTSDLTVQVLREIRDDIRGMRADHARFEEHQLAFNERQEAFNERQEAFNERQEAFNEQALARFEAIEGGLRDLAEQLVMLARGIKVAIEAGESP